LLFSKSAISQVCLSGQILNKITGEFIPDANIKLENGGGISSDGSGNFHLCGLTPGPVKIIISCMGYKTKDVNIDLSMGENTLTDNKLEPSIITIDELVITATRTENTILNTPARINIIPNHMIATIPMQTVDDAIKYLPGMNISRPFGIFSTKGIATMRGMSGKEQGRVLVLLDGVPINKSDGGSVDWNMIDVNNIKKIEISKGAGSALYGGNAMGGIINVITKLPDYKPFVSAKIEYGTFNTFGGGISAGQRLKMKSKNMVFYWMSNVFAKKSDGYITQSEADIKANPYIVKSNMKEAGINVKTGFIYNTNHTFETLINYYNDRRGTGEKVFQSEGNTTDHDSYSIVLNYKGILNSVQVKTSAYLLTENYKKVNEYLKDDYTWYNVFSARRDFGLFSTATRACGNQNLITAGIEVKNGTVDAYDKYFTSTDIVFNKGSMLTSALFIQDEVGLLENKMRIIGGVRLDLNYFYNGSFRIEHPTMETEFMNTYQVPSMPIQNSHALSPRLSIQYKWNEKTRFYTLFSRGFRPSVLDDLCRSGRIKGGFKIANPALKPEYLNNFEAGFDFEPLKNTSTSVSAFYSRGSDFQYYVQNGQYIDMGFGDRPIFIRANISDVEIFGAELEMKYDVLSTLSIFANYTFTSSMIKKYHKIAGNDTISLAGKYFTDVPFSIMNAGINFTGKWLNFAAFVHYNGAMYINDQNTWDEILKSEMYSSYSTLDIKLWHVFHEKYKITCNVQNLLDKKYFDSKYAVCPGRFITLEATFNF